MMKVHHKLLHVIIVSMALVCAQPGICGGPVYWSQDGTRMATSNEKTIYVFDAAGNEIRRLVFEAPLSGVAFSPNGRYLAYVMLGQQVWIYDVDTGAKVQVFEPAGITQISKNLTWSADSQNLTYVVLDIPATSGNGERTVASLYMVKPDGTNKKLLLSYNH